VGGLKAELDGGEGDGFADADAVFGCGSEGEGSGVEVVGEGELFGGEAAGSGAPVGLFGAGWLPSVFGVLHLWLFSVSGVAVWGLLGLFRGERRGRGVQCLRELTGE
jgi:hypothetical protein